MRLAASAVVIGVGAAWTPAAGLVSAAADRPCVVVVQSGDSLSLIADSIPDPAVTVASIQAENGIGNADVIEPGQQLDVCVGNGVDDVTGATTEPAAVPADASGVEAQQRKLNELFAGRGIAELAVDGDSGPLTRQQLCAFRLARNLPISRADMAPGSEEERLLMATTTLPIPPTAAIGEDRWILIDKTCQVMFAGELTTRIVFVFGTSTGEPGLRDRHPGRRAGVPLRPGTRERGLAQQHDVPGRRRQPAEREHVPAGVLLQGRGDPRREQRAATTEEQGLRTAAGREPGCADRVARSRRRLRTGLEP